MVSRWVLQNCQSYAVWGSYSGPLFLLKPETKKKEHYIQQQSLKRLLLFAEATKFNNLQFNYCNCLVLCTLATIVNRSRFGSHCQHNVHWTKLQYETLLVTWTCLSHYWKLRFPFLAKFATITGNKSQAAHCSCWPLLHHKKIIHFNVNTVCRWLFLCFEQFMTSLYTLLWVTGRTGVTHWHYREKCADD